MAFVGTGIWYICTAGSDQMAIQRYLATRDVTAARRMFHITLLMNLLSWSLLTILGFALLTGIVIGYLGVMLGLGRPAPPLPSAE